MRVVRVAVVLVAILSAVLVARSGGATDHHPVVGFVYAGKFGLNVSLARYDAVMLRAASGGRVGLDGRAAGWGFSPGRQTLAVGYDNESCVGGSSSVQLVDTVRMRRLGDVSLLPNGSVEAIDWLDRTRLLAVVQVSDCINERNAVVFAINSRTLTVTSRTPVPGDVVGVARAPGKLVLLLAPRGRIGAAKLAVLDPQGAARVVALPGVGAGEWFPYVGMAPTRTRLPALAVAGGEALVVPAEGPIAAVKLSTLAVRSHSLHQARSLQKGAIGPVRKAVALGNGLVAVTGWNLGIASGRPSATPAGLELIDPRTWRFRTVASDVATITVSDGSILAQGGPTSTGLSAYSLSGHLRYRLFPNLDVTLIGAGGGRGYAYVGGLRRDLRVVVFDSRSGRVIGEPKGFPGEVLLGTSETFEVGGY